MHYATASCVQEMLGKFSAAEIKRGYHSGLTNKYVGASENAAETLR
jgi:hypothetical protein